MIENRSNPSWGKAGGQVTAHTVQLNQVEVRNALGQAVAIAGDPEGGSFPPLQVSIVDSVFSAPMYNPIEASGLAKLDVRNSRLSAENRDLYCIGLSGEASYTASGLTMQCAGSPTGSTAVERASEQ